MRVNISLKDHGSVTSPIASLMAEMNKKLSSISKEFVANELEFRNRLSQHNLSSIKAGMLTPNIDVCEFEDWIIKEAKKICRDIFENYERRRLSKEACEYLWSRYQVNYKRFTQLKQLSRFRADYLFNIPDQVKLQYCSKVHSMHCRYQFAFDKIGRRLT